MVRHWITIGMLAIGNIKPDNIPAATVVVRCRYQGNIGRAEKAGASAVISEAAEASGALLRWCERFVSSAPVPGRPDFVNVEENQ